LGYIWFKPCATTPIVCNLYSTSLAGVQRYLHHRQNHTIIGSRGQIFNEFSTKLCSVDCDLTCSHDANYFLSFKLIFPRRE
jgi:hypothetical protein